MHNLNYKRILSECDKDISQLIDIYQTPQISQYIHIDNNYWQYISNTENVYFYKIYDNNKLIGTTHLEKQNDILFMDILVFPEYQKMGFGTKIIKDIQNDIFNLNYEKIEIYIDETNISSIKLFENAGFEYLSQNDELINYIYPK